MNPNTGALTNRHVFQPVALETLDAMDSPTLAFLSGLGRRLTDTSGVRHHSCFSDCQ